MGKSLVPLGSRLMTLLPSCARLSVAATHRNQAVARQLCDRAFDEAEKQAIKSVYLITTTADRYFQRLGFTVVDRSTVPDAITKTSQFSSLCPASATVMKQNQSL